MTSVEGDRKRSLSDQESSDAKKPKPLNVLSEDGPLTQQDVVYFQKEAIWRQMEIYRQKALLTARDLAKYKQKYEENETKLNILDSWYEQLISIFDGIEPSDDINEELLIRSTNTPNSSLDSVLETRRNNLLKVISPVLKSVKANISIESKSLIDKFESLNSELASTKASKESFEKLKQQLEQRVESLQEQVLDLVKSQQRSQSKTLKRLDGNAEQSEESEERKESNGTEIKSEDVKPDIKEESEPTQPSNEEMESLQNQLDELKSTNKLLVEQLEEVTEKYNKSQAEVISLDNKIHNLQESDLIDNIYYKNVIKNNRSLQDQIAKLGKINDQNIAKLNQFEEAQNDLVQLISKDLISENTHLKEQLNKSETDLIRIRAARDELISKQAILKSQLEKHKTNEELVKLNEILTSRLEQLETDQFEKISHDGADKLQDLDKTELIKRIELLSNEIKEIEAAFKQTREVSLKKLVSHSDQENLVKKLTIEKTKADQKYFAAMRLKDSLQGENKLLKIQMNKSRDLLKNSTDLEKNYINKIDNLTKSINDYKVIKENSLQENIQLQDSVKSLKSSKDSLESEVKKLLKTIESNASHTTRLETELNANKVTINKLEKSVKTYENAIKKYKQNNPGSLLQQDEEQLEALRSIAKCSVCSKNWKDTAITVCGHVFCHNCTQERLAARLRRCPSCNKGFSANDLLSIHL